MNAHLASRCRLLPAAHRLNASNVVLHSSSIDQHLQDAGSEPHFVKLFGYWYSLNTASGVFEKVSRMPADLPEQLGKALNALAAVDQGVRAY